MLRATLSQKQTSNSEESPMQESLLYERSEEWHAPACAWFSSRLLGQGRWEAVVSQYKSRTRTRKHGLVWVLVVCFEVGSLSVFLAILELAV